MPVNPPEVNKKMKERDQRRVGESRKGEPYKDASQLKILIPVGIAIIIVAEVK